MQMRKWWLIVLLGFVTVGLYAGLTWVIFIQSYGTSTGDKQWTNQLSTNLPVLAVWGVITLLLFLTIMGVVFKNLGLAHSNEALALPSGSIRAVIALSLIVIFIISFIYLNETFVHPSLVVSKGITLDQVHTMQASGATIVRIDLETPNMNPNPAYVVTTTPVPNSTSAVPAATSNQTYDVWTASPTNQASQDLAKQVITLVGTLMASIASFYFGTKAVEGTQQATKGPEVTGVDPEEAKCGETLSIKINGTKFTGANAVSLGTGITINSFTVDKPTQITANITIDKNAVPGIRDVSVTTPEGTGTLAGKFTVIK